MKAKLIKERFDFYGLKVDSKIIATNIVEVNKMFNYPFTISFKNCQAIELGYDLEDLARKRFNPEYESNLMFSIFEIDCKREGFKEGAKAILEILGDKKFSEEDMINAHYIGWIDRGESNKVQYPRAKNNYIKSLQQTEWDVEICCYVDNTDGWLDADSFNSPLCTNTGIPKLDSEGCLILKRL